MSEKTITTGVPEFSIDTIDDAVKRALAELYRQAEEDHPFAPYVSDFQNPAEGVPKGGWVVIDGSVDMRALVAVILR